MSNTSCSLFQVLGSWERKEGEREKKMREDFFAPPQLPRAWNGYTSYYPRYLLPSLGSPTKNSYYNKKKGQVSKEIKEYYCDIV